MSADRPEGGSDHTPATLNQKDGAQDQEQSAETLGQRLLQEPIWIGLIVILSVIFLSGVFYLIRRKWGRKFNCCEIKKPKEDDNILNADGTITLNSFPLKRMTRPPTLSPISISPSHRSYTLSETPTPNPTANNHSAAARFFASYKDAVRSPISTTVTTDFIKPCDTSMSHDVEESSVGAIVGGRLLLNLHVKEQQHQETMTRAQSLMFSSTRVSSKDKVKRSYSLGPFHKGQNVPDKEQVVSFGEQQNSNGDVFSAISANNNSDKGSAGNRIKNVNGMDHLYPNVIIHASQNFHSDDEEGCVETTIANDESCRAYSHQYASTRRTPNDVQMSQPDSSGARIIQVDIEGGSSGSGEASVVPVASPAKRSPRLSLNHISKSADSVLEHFSQGGIPGFTDHHESFQNEKLQLYAQMLGEWKSRARQRYRLAKFAAQKEKDDFYNQRFRERSGYHGSRMRSSPCQHHRKAHTAPHPLRRTKTVDVDHSSFANDISARRARFSGRQGRQFTSMDGLDRHEQKASRRHHRHRIRDTDELPCFTDCDCSECLANMSASFNSDISSVVRSAVTSQDLPAYSSASYKSERPQTNRAKFSSRSVSTTSDPLKRHSHRSFRRGGSFQRRGSIRSNNGHKYRQRRSRHGSGPTKTTRTLHVNNALSSSTDSDFNWRVIQSKQNTLSIPTSPGKSFSLGLSREEYTTVNELEYNTLEPSIQITDSTIPVPKTDVFHTMFSQVVESDDLNSAEDEDEPYILQSKPSSKQNILCSVPLPIENAQTENNDKVKRQNSVYTNIAGHSHDVKTPALQPNDSMRLESETTPKFSNRRNTCNVITVKTTGSLDGKAFKTSSLGSSTSRDKSENSCGTPTTCNVIVYDSSASFDTSATPPVVKTKFILTKKHSSLDLSNPHRLQPCQNALRNASSMQELTNKSDEVNNSQCPERPDSHSQEKASVSDSAAPVPISPETTPKTSHRQSEDINAITGTSEVFIVEPVHKPQRQRTKHAKNTPYQTSKYSTSSKENINFVPKTPASSVDDIYVQPSGRHEGSVPVLLPVSDTDPSSGSAQTTPNSLLYNKTSEQKVKDSAYQTKQSSVDVEACLEPRIRRHPQPPKEEERRVTQRLHQAAVKLLVMQQRLRRARQHLSKDSAVHTISEDDPSLDDIIVVSPKTRTFKPGVLYPAPALREGETVADFPPTIYGRIIEEQDPSVEYEV
ncbi:hypothetical protein ElyMa_003773000 [Elysia marginata]|uniref:Uncharacterized protein n=1 Tax=Elysia marginata TaxID=1093978 RepID=A0AAV4F9Q8_9GAST|nr:hypothetical protein ElyMa_003773000 [Elysia marginata]